MSKKIIYLLIALCLPALIFVFLKFFGKNQFDIPVYFKDGVEKIPSVCSGDYSKPYVLPDSIMKELWQEGSYKAAVINFDSSAEVRSNLERLFNDIGRGEMGIVNLPSARTGQSDETIARWKSCIFMLEKPWTAVLVDDQMRIRGYYSPATLEETDRLIVESKILLKKY